MAKITDFDCFAADGRKLKADSFGNNIALVCPDCQEYPVLVIAREHQRGMKEENPAICRGCNSKFIVTVDSNHRRIIVHGCPS